MLHPDASGMKHGTRETHENYLGFVYAVASSLLRRTTTTPANPAKLRARGAGSGMIDPYWT